MRPGYLIFVTGCGLQMEVQLKARQIPPQIPVAALSQSQARREVMLFVSMAIDDFLPFVKKAQPSWGGAYIFQ
jgi:hypothetical protein